MTMTVLGLLSAGLNSDAAANQVTSVATIERTISAL